MSKMNLDEMENYINIIRDETNDGSELETLVERLNSLINEFQNIWDSPAASRARGELVTNLAEFRITKQDLNRNGKLITDHANILIEINK